MIHIPDYVIIFYRCCYESLIELGAQSAANHTARKDVGAPLFYVVLL